MMGTVGHKGETGEGRGLSGNERKDALKTKKREGGDKGKENPWKIRQGRAGEDWKPEAWAPGKVER